MYAIAMPAELVIAPEVESDIEEAFAWYEERRAGLGQEFLSCVDACVQAVCRDPEIYARVHKAYRRGLVRRFPYAVFYELAHDTVTVYGVFHTARNQKTWRQRLA